VLVTHDQDEALSTADRVAVLRDAAPRKKVGRHVEQAGSRSSPA
jgi:ABC-type proline/glycine betaine transport system ATPase subunit